MAQYVIILFLLLSFALILSLVKRGKYAVMAKVVRWGITMLSFVFFGYWFVQRSIPVKLGEAMAFQIVNKLPQTVDFYILKIRKEPTERQDNVQIKHPGKIRTEHYRLEYINMNNSDEYWVVGYLGKKNLVYFSQHWVPNKNMDQVVEINNYFNQSEKLSNIANESIQSFREQQMKVGVWVSLCFLLTFLNVGLMIPKKLKG